MSETKRDTVGVIVGRFESPYLHTGHIHLISTVQAQCTILCFVLGTHGYGAVQQDRYPMDIATRTVMLQGLYPDTIILHIQDAIDPTVWSKNLDKLLTETFPDKEIILYGSRDCFSKDYYGVLGIKEIDEIPDASATAIRLADCSEPIDSIDFRKACIYQVMNRPGIAFSCVDVVPYRVTWHGIEVLRGARTKEYGQQRFIGGFTDPSDDSHRDAARRELCKEEARGISIGELHYLRSMKIGSPYYRNTRDVMMTNIFIAPAFAGSEVAGDDIDALYWIPLHEIKRGLIKEHHAIADEVLSYFETRNTFFGRFWMKVQLWLNYPAYR